MLSVHGHGMGSPMDQSGQDRGADLTRAEVDAVFIGMTAADWRRAEHMASFAARGVPGKSGEDMLQDALEQFLAGRRRFPRGRHPLVVLKTAMRSNASNARKAERRSPIENNVSVTGHSMETDDLVPTTEGSDRRTPLAELEAKELLEAIFSDLAEDADALMVAMAWAEGLRGAAAIETTGLTGHQYDAARKRLLRKLTSHDADRSAS